MPQAFAASRAPVVDDNGGAELTELHIAIEHAMTGISRLDRDGVFVEVRPGYAKMLGYKPDELIGQSWTSTVPTTDIPLGETAYSTMLENGRAEGELRGLRKDGSEFFKQVLLVKTLDSRGKRNGHYCFMRDVSERRESQQALARSKAYSDRLLNSVADGIVVLDGAGRIAALNDSLCEMLEYDRDELQGLPGVPYLPAEATRKAAVSFRRSLRQPGSDFELNLQKKSGDRIDVLVSPSQTVDDHGNELYVATVKDITERKLAEDKLLQYEKSISIGSLASGIAHDLNNLLTPMLGFSELASATDDPEVLQVALREIHEASLKARALIAQINEFSSSRAVSPKPVRLAPLLADALGIIRASLPSTIKLNHTAACTRDLVIADPAKLQQVLMNLCSNAGDAMRNRGGELRVDLANHDARHVRLRVTDTGEGMSRSVLQQIFEPYFTTKSAGKGTGLGLSIVQRIVTDMGGRIDVRSELGTGSQFDVILPVTKDAGAPTDDPGASNGDAPLANPRASVMLIDDEPSVLEFASRALSMRGYTPVSFQSPSAALQELLDSPNGVDLICVDHTMPEMTGIEFVAALRGAGHNHPVIMMTGRMGSVSEVDLSNLSIASRLAKPFTVDELEHCLESVSA